MILEGPLPEAPAGLWLLEGVPCAGKSTLLHRWRRGTAAPVLWAAEDLATQRLFEPLEDRHHPGAVEPWLQALLGGWGQLRARAAGAPWGAPAPAFLALQERFHLSAEVAGGLGPGAFRALDAALAEAGARGVLLRVSAETLARRLAASLEARPPAWGRWLERRWGGLEGAKTAFLAEQGRLEALAAESLLPWLLSQS